MTVAEGADLLREYEDEIVSAGVEGEQAECVAETIADLEVVLDDVR